MSSNSAVAVIFCLLWLPAAGSGDMRRVGYLTMDSAEVHVPFAAAFRQGLRDSGYIEGQNIAIEWRFAANNSKALSSLVAALIGLNVEVLVADSTPAALAARRATQTIAIVVPTSGDLVRAGLVASLARPGGNLTGLQLMSPGLIGKRLAVLKEMAPRIHKVAVLINPDNPASQFQLSEAEVAAPQLGLKAQPVLIRRPEDIEPTLSSYARRVDAILITDDALMDNFRTQIGTFAIKNRLPSICGYRMPKDKTCLIWYGPDLLGMYRRSASYVARILNGTKPADLPVEQPAKLTLVINAKTASYIGVRIPQSLLLSADEVIR